MLKKFRLNHKAVMFAAAMTLVSTAGYAQSLLLEEVVVTARKTEETLQDVPIAVTSFTGSQLEALGVQETGDLALITPNFTWNTEFGRASPQPYLRGIGTNNFAPINTGPIAIYQDDVFIGPNIAQAFATFDVERAEVLKGPQGTLYGRNSTGGLVNFISKKPVIGGGTRGFVNIEVGEFETTNLEAAVGFELGETSAARIAILRNVNGGSFDSTNPAVDEQNTIDDTALRAAIAFAPSDKFSGLFNFHYGDASPDTAPFQQVGLFENTPEGGLGEPCSDTSGRFNTNCAALLSQPGSTDIFTTDKNEDSEKVETSGAFLQLEYAISDNLTVNSITSYDTADLERLDDADDTITELELDHYFDEFEFFSQEIRFSGTSGDKTNWQAGAYYYDETNQGILAFVNPIFDNGEANAHAVDTVSYAVFGNIDYAVNDRLNIGGGLRWTYEEKDVQQYDVFQVTAGSSTELIRSINDSRVLRNSIASGTTGARDFDEITGRLSIDYTTAAGNLWYASLSRGFKGGDVVGAGLIFDFNGLDQARSQESIDILRAQTEIVEPEILDAFEIGFKGDFGDTVRFNAAVFFYDYSNQQQTVLQPDPTGQSPIGITTLSNAATADILGIEGELIYTPNENWFFQTTAGLLDAEYDTFGNPLSGGIDFSGNRIPLTAEYEFSALGRYNKLLSGGANVAFQLSVSVKGDTFFQAQNSLDNTSLQEDSVTIWNGRVSYLSADSKWSLALVGKNLANEEYFGSGFDVTGLGYLAIKPGAPRYFGVEARYSFGE